MERDDRETHDIIGAALKVHRTWGPGYLEAVYHKSLEIELQRRGHQVRTQVPFALSYEGISLGTAYRADLVCGDILLEVKAHSGLGDADFAQVIHYLRCSGLGRGLLLNFGLASLQARRFVNGWDDALATDRSPDPPMPDKPDSAVSA
jgi:GxxExxY protein